MIFSFIQNVLSSYIRQVLLTERVFGAQAFVYHGSDVSPEKLIPAFVSDTFRPGGRDMYGKGMYTVYDFAGTKTEAGGYGSYIYKLKN